jgi:hypothetical protein
MTGSSKFVVGYKDGQEITASNRLEEKFAFIDQQQRGFIGFTIRSHIAKIQNERWERIAAFKAMTEKAVSDYVSSNVFLKSKTASSSQLLIDRFAAAAIEKSTNELTATRCPDLVVSSDGKNVSSRDAFQKNARSWYADYQLPQ